MRRVIVDSMNLTKVNVDIVVANFRLGLNGGATLFNLVTKLNNGVAWMHQGWK